MNEQENPIDKSAKKKNRRIGQREEVAKGS
jgi:hypothetical protein